MEGESLRYLAIATITALAACSPKSDAPETAATPHGTVEDAAAGFSGVGKDRAGGEPNHDDPLPEGAAKVAREQIIGTGSFDRTCAPSDGMQVNADGTAGFDEWGSGTWTINGEGKLVM